MGRSKKKPFFEGIEIVDLAAEGKAIAKHNDMVIFVPGVIPGDIVDIQITKKRKKYMEGIVRNIQTFSTERISPFCEHFGVCGGCKWQMLPYEKQLFYKQKQVSDNFQRLGKFQFPEIPPILGSKKTTHYRNKLEFSFSNKRWLTKNEIDSGEVFNENALGFHVPGRFDKIVNISECHLQGNPSNDIRNTIALYAREHHLDFYDIREQKGFLRSLIIRTASTGENMVILSFYEDKKDEIKALLEFINEQFPNLASIMYVINAKGNDTINDLDILCYTGKDHIIERMEDLAFKVGPKSFYQTNSEQAYELYKITREYAQISENDIVYDLYTGTGTIANFVAKQAKAVIGIEYVPEAIDDAIINSELNAISNTSFYAGDIKQILTNQLIEKHGKPDIIITDPPRAGMDPHVIETILHASPKRIVYVSCNPATQARDIALMQEQYTVTKVQPVDMFPHTHHVENVVLLEKIH